MPKGRASLATPVLVAGGGPVGLATAMELAHHGIESVVIERREEVSWLRPRAKTTSARTMEHFRRWGLADALRARAPIPVAWSDQAVFCTSLLGREITRFDRCFGLDLAGSDLASEPGQQVAQPVVEQLLREAVVATGAVTFLAGADVVAAGQDHDGAWADVAIRGEPARRITAEFVIGCEGARSVVREAIGSRYAGNDDPRPNLNVIFRAPGLAERVTHGPAVHYWVLDTAHPGLIGRLDLGDTWWCIAQGVDASAGDVHPERIVATLVGADIAVEVLATDAWRARMLLADSYGRGRLFIAGDAAHQNPPWGGHGFNTGVGDAVNLGWKLAATIQGWGGPYLLDSYEAERRPVAQRTIDEAARNMETLSPELSDPALGGTDEEFDAVRPAVADAIHLNKDSEFHSLDLTLGYHYRGSPIVLAERSTERLEPAGEPGRRLPHRWLGVADSLYDHLGRDFTLLGDVESADARGIVDACKAARVPLTTFGLAEADRRALLGAPLSLVRADQHVAWRGGDATGARSVVGCVTGFGCGSFSGSA